jgi:hypothetical protein
MELVINLIVHASSWPPRESYHEGHKDHKGING